MKMGKSNKKGAAGLLFYVANMEQNSLKTAVIRDRNKI